MGTNPDADRLAEELAAARAQCDRLEAKLRSERIKAQLARRDAEKIQQQAAGEKQSIVEVLNDLVIEHTALKQSASREALEAAQAIRQRDQTIANYQTQLHDVTAMLQDVRQSISFRVMVMAGRPIAAVLRMLRAGRSNGK